MLSRSARTRPARAGHGRALPPRRRRPRERPGELLDAALRAFAARGYRGTSIDDVAAEAGVTKGAVYHYFRGKEDLLVRALDRHQERLSLRLEGALRGGGAAERVRLFLGRAFGGDDPARRDALVLLQGLAHESPAVYRRWLANGLVRGWRLLAALIEEGRAAGEFRRDVDADAVARVAMTGLLGQLVLQRHAGTVPAVRTDPDRLIDATADLLLAGMRPAAIRGTGARTRRGPRRGREEARPT